MKRDIILEKNKPYHIIARAVEGRSIFTRKDELDRFIVQMYIANFGNPFHMKRKDVAVGSDALLFGKEIPSFLPTQNKTPLVRCFSFALVGNHYHFGLVGCFDNAISKYMQRLNTGFAKYFNLKHKRTGSLFGTRFRAVAVTDPRQLSVLINYINIKNVLDVCRPHWSDIDALLMGREKALRFVHDYPYSSFATVFLERNSHLIDQNILRDISEGAFPAQSHHSQESIFDVIRSKGVTLDIPTPLE